MLVDHMKIVAIVLLGGLGTLSKEVIYASLQGCAPSVVSTWKGKQGKIVLLGGLGTLSKVVIYASLQGCAQSVVSTWKGK